MTPTAKDSEKVALCVLKNSFRYLINYSSVNYHYITSINWAPDFCIYVDFQLSEAEKHLCVTKVANVMTFFPSH